MKNDSSIMVRPYLIKELSNIYGISHPTFKKWMKSIEHDIGTKVGLYYSVRQVEIIFMSFGIPYKIEDRILTSSQF